MGKSRGGETGKGVFVQKTNQDVGTKTDMAEKYKSLETIALSTGNVKEAEKQVAKTLKKFKSLSPDEKEQLKYYTGSWAYEINPMLRAGHEMDKVSLERVAMMDKALAALPKYEQLYFRKLEFSNAEAKATFFDQHKVGNVVRYSAYTSAARVRGKMGFDSKGESNIRLFLHGKAALVEGFSEHSHEKEGLFARNSEFKVESIRTDGEVKEVYIRQVK